jgi:cell division protein FtsQ
MARKSSPTISQEELYPPGEESVRPELEDARVLDLDGEEESPFLRGQKRVSVRRGTLPKKTANRLKWIVLAAAIVCLVIAAAGAAYRYGEHSWRFRLQSSDDIEISGNHNVTHLQVMEVLGGDIGRNVFFVPLAQRRAELEKIPWVESASVMRFVPNRLRVEIQERTPVAFARVGSRISLIDAGGTLMELPPNNKKKYSFPVLIGMNSGEPLSVRAPRMRVYNRLVRELDSDGARYSQDLSEVDLSDLDDVKVLANDPHGAVLVHLGSENFLDRYKVYVTHVQEWRQQFEKLDSVDLRYDRQIVVNPDLRGRVKQAPLTATAARVAAAAGVKPAALIAHEIRKSDPAASSKVPSGTASPTKQAAKPSWKKQAKLHKAKRAAARAKAQSRARVTTAVNVTPAAQKQPVSQPAGSSERALGSTVSSGKKKPSPAIMKEQN